MKDRDALLPPHSIESEEAVIGSLLIDGTMIQSLTLTPDCFYHEINQCLYSACLSLKEKGTSINQITLAQELDERDKLEACGGAAYLSHLISITPTSMDCLHYAEIVQRLATFRGLIGAGEAIEKLGYSSNGNVDKALTKADDLLLNLRKHSGSSSSIVTPRERVEMMSELYADRASRENGAGLSTGLLDLDLILDGGLFEDDYILVAGRPSMGKTSLLRFISNNVAVTHNVLFCSAEMGIIGVSDRDVAAIAGVPIGAVRRGQYDEETNTKIMDALGQMDEMKVYFNRRVPLTTDGILQQAVSMQARYGLDLVTIDYLGILADDYGRSAYERISHISGKLKQMNQTLGVPILVGQQLNRDLEQRSEKRPVLPDLRESGRLEEDADVILFIYREDYYYKEQAEWDRAYPQGNDYYKSYPKGIVEIIMGKKRQGGTDIRGKKFLWDNDHQSYLHLARE